MIIRCISYANVWYLNISLIEAFYKMGHYRMRIKISTCCIPWIVQAIDLIDCDHGDDLNKHGYLLENKYIGDLQEDPHMDICI